MTKHTPGPWGAQAMYDNNLTIGIDYPEGDDRDHYLAEVTCGDPDELQANANLISASPELLAACKAALKLLDSVAFVANEGDTKKPMRLLCTAIAKATGASA